jgi:flavin-dependent dehydrogenase
MTLVADIAVIGGGPAGAVIASRLTGLGHAVVLLDGRLARPWPGCETLTAGAADQLAFLGLGSVLDRVPTRRTTPFELKWSSDRFEPHDAFRPGALVERCVFDPALMAAVRRTGVPAHPVEARRSERTARGWRIAGIGADGPATIIARMLVDASGRRGFLPKRRRRAEPLLAVHGRWQGRRLPACMRIAAGPQAWAWGVPITDQTYAATVFLDPRDRRHGMLARRYHDLVEACGLLEGATPSELFGPVTACDATPYVEDAAIGADCLKIGEAALAVDPLSSAGVQIAIQSAVAAAAVVHTLLGDPAAIALVTAFWSRELARRSARHAAWTAAFYREAAARFATPFWRLRASEPADVVAGEVAPLRGALPRPDEPLRLAESLTVAPAPCLVHDRVEQRRIVSHPALTEPVAFVDGADLPLLLDRISSGLTAAAILSAWSSTIGPTRALAVLSWMWRGGLIVPARG